MQIINYFDYDDKTSIISQLEILQGEWRAIGFLISLLNVSPVPNVSTLKKKVSNPTICRCIFL